MGEVRINEAFRPLYESKKRYFIVTGGRGALKSSSIHDFIARLTYEAGHGVLFTRYTMTSAEISIIPEFAITLQRLGVIKDFEITKNIVRNKRTGSFIYFSGIKSGSKDNTGRLKSIAGITTWVIEEGEDFKDEKTFNIIDDSIRMPGVRNRVIWIQNPTTKEHFIYQKFIKDHQKQIEVEGYKVTVSGHEDVEHIHTTYKLAEKLGYLNEEWLKKAEGYKSIADEAERLKIAGKQEKGKYESHYYYNYVGGWLERSEDAIFKNWSFGKFDDKLPYCYGMDLGYNPDPLAVLKVAVDSRSMKIYLMQKIYEIELDDIDRRFEQVGIKKTELIVSDTNEERTISALKKKKWNIQKAIKNKIVEDIREMNNYEIVVDNEGGQSSDLVAELNNYEWNDKKSSTPIDEWNHLLDASRYGFVRLTKKRLGVKRRN